MMKIFLLLFLSLLFVSCGHSIKIADMEFISKVQPVEWHDLTRYDSLNALPYPDSGGLGWYSPEYRSAHWRFLDKMSELDMINWNCDNCDKFLKGSFIINEDDYAENAFYAEFAAKDGLWIYVNGNLLGHWGGDIHQPGNVNIKPDGKPDTKPRVKIPKEYLKEGFNVINIHATESSGDELLHFKLWMSPF